MLGTAAATRRIGQREISLARRFLPRKGVKGFVRFVVEGVTTEGGMRISTGLILAGLVTACARGAEVRAGAPAAAAPSEPAAVAQPKETAGPALSRVAALLQAKASFQAF